jgi:hypothetical protein
MTIEGKKARKVGRVVKMEGEFLDSYVSVKRNVYFKIVWGCK